MPPVVGAAVAAGAAYAFALPATIAAWGGPMMFIAKQFALNLVLSYAASALTPKPKMPSTITQRGNDQQFKQPITSRDIVYGEVRQSGPIIYVESTNSEKYLHMVIALAGHEVNSIQEYYVDDLSVTLDGDGFVTDSKYTEDGTKLLRIKSHLGASDQAADADLISESGGLWTNDHRLRETAYIYVRMEYSQEVFSTGVPSFSVVLRGREIYGITSGAVDGSAAYSNNAALVLFDYLRDSTYGLGCPDSEIDLDSFESAADICDEDVTLAAGGTEKRYTANGILDTQDTPKKNIEKLISAMGGQLVYAGGQFKCYPAAYYSPVKTITLDDIIGDIQVQTRTSRRANYNAIKGVFVSPESNWQPTDYPAITSETFESVDNGERKFLDLELPFTTSSAMAQRIAKIALYREREQIGVQIRTNLKAIDVAVGDTVSLTIDRYGWSAKTFTVLSWAISPSEQDGMGIDLSLKEISSSVFDWNADEKTFESENSNLPDGFAVNPPGISLDDELRAFNQTAVSVLIADITTSGGTVTQFEVQAKKSTDSVWVNLGRASGARFELYSVEDGVDYNVRARAINSFGIRSAWTEATRNIIGKAAPPEDVINFKVNIIGDSAHCSWDAVGDLDLSHYRIRHHSSTSSAEYSDSSDIAPRVGRPATSAIVPAKTGTYFIKAVDKTGNTSINAVSSVAIVNKIGRGTITNTLTEHSTFTGTKTNCSVDSGSLIIDSGNTTATYDFANSIDFGSKYTARFESTVEYTRYDRSNLFDSAGGLFDARSGFFDGGASADFDDVDVELQIRSTDDDPSGTPTWTSWRAFTVTEMSARAFEFRLILNSDDTNVSPQVTALTVTAEMPERVEAESDISSGASSYSVTFSPAFKALLGIGIAAADLSSGDYYEITSKSETGFTITFKNSGGTAVDRTFDYVARGYGEVI